jgi:hypothetical protein
MRGGRGGGHAQIPFWGGGHAQIHDLETSIFKIFSIFQVTLNCISNNSYLHC